jgi:hypothetical protein
MPTSNLAKSTCPLEFDSLQTPDIGPPTNTPHIPIATCSSAFIADTGSTAHFCTTTTSVINKRSALNPIAIRNPNGSIMYSTHEAELDLPLLPKAARQVHIVPELANHSLLSIGQLCDAGCDVSFNATNVTVCYDNQPILTGQRTPATQLWHLQPPTTIPAQANAAVGSATPAQIVAFAHAALFSPTLSTLLEALKRRFLTNFPGLTERSLRKHPPQSFPMIKGHLDQTRKNQRSTKIPPDQPATDINTDAFPTDTTTTRSHHCYALIFEPTGQIYTDQTGKFVTPSSNGNNYLMVVYDYDSNCIFAEPFKNKSAQSILTAYQTVHAKLCAAGLRPQLQRLDNECSAILKQFMRDEQVDFQLVPPGNHRRNAAERAIRTFKNHFIAGLCSLDPQFPLHLWDRLVPQAELSLNLLRGSRLNPKLSAWAQINGTFDFNRTPIAPPGIRVLVHARPTERTSWSPHALDGWYTGPALDSYRCYKVWIWETRGERICETISWFPTKVTMPLASSTDLILAGIQDIVRALHNPTQGSPIAPLTDSHVQALQQLTTLLTGIVSPSATNKPQSNIPARAASPSVAPLRVLTSLSPNSPASPAPPLRVEPTLIPPTEDDLPNTQVPHHTVRFTPNTIYNEHNTPIVRKRNISANVDSFPKTTYDNSTGPKSRRRHTQPRSHHHRHNTRASKARTRANKAQAAMAAIQLQPTNPDCDFMHYALHGNAFNPDTGKIAEYKELKDCSEGSQWRASCADEFGRLCQGHGKDMPTGTETMFFIHPRNIPKAKKPTYMRIVAAYRPEKKNPHRVRFTCGGDKITYDGEVSTKTADMSTVKVLLNDVISTPNAKYMTMDLSNFYLETPMDDYEYMRIPRWVIPETIMDEYNLSSLIINDYLYVEIRKGMYGLPQSGRIANDRLTKFLAPHGYAPVPITPGLWKHETRPLAFTLVVDDFGVKYTNQDDADHLLHTLEKLYTVSTDWTGSKYCGMTLTWDYKNRTCDISMPGYIDRALHRFSHPQPSRPQHAPHAWQRPIYGARTQYATDEDTSPLLSSTDTKRVQEVLGTLLFYARAVDPTMLVAIGDIATQQAKGTQATMQAITHLLNYCATHPTATIRYIASDMCLHIDSDASYLSVSKARSRSAGFHYLSNKPSTPGQPPKPTDPFPIRNGAILTPCQILREVVSSAAEAELAGLFHNGKEACPLRITLQELGYPQPPTVIVTDNSTASGIANDTVKQKRSKAIDMRFYWIRDRVRQGQFHILWKKGSLNQADYFTKHHPATHHQAIRSAYLHDPNNRSKNYFEVLQEKETSVQPLTQSVIRTPFQRIAVRVC